MGAATSSSASGVTPILPESHAALTADDIATQVRALGKSYEKYAEKFIEDGLDGAFFIWMKWFVL